MAYFPPTFPTPHQHQMTDVPELPGALDLKEDKANKGVADGYADLDSGGKLPLSELPSHTHAESDVTNLVSDLAGKAALSHTHSESDITGLASDLAAKANTASPTLTTPLLAAATAITDAAPHNMTGNTSPSPYVASAESADGSSGGAFAAFDGQTPNTAAHIWIATIFHLPSWLQIDLGSANACCVTSYALTCGSQGWNGSQMAKDWTLQGSNNGSAWTTLDTQTGATGWGDGETRTYVCNAASPTAFRYYRISVTANNGDPYLSIAEVSLYPSKKGQFEYIDNGTDGHLYFTRMSGGVLTRTQIL